MMLEKLKQQNLSVRILIFYGLQFVYFYMRLSMNTENEVIRQYSMFFFVIDIITFVIFSVYLFKTFRLPLKGRFFSMKPLSCLLIGLLFLLIYGNLRTCLSVFFPFDSNAAGLGEFATQFPFAIFFFSSIVAPVVEESIFRGVFFQLFFQKLTKWQPYLLILVSGLIFGSIHVQAGGFAWQNLLFYSIFGWFFGTVYYFNRDLRVNMLLHFAYNTASQFAPFIFSLLWKLLM